MLKKIKNWDFSRFFLYVLYYFPMEFNYLEILGFYSLLEKFFGKGVVFF